MPHEPIRPRARACAQASACLLGSPKGVSRTSRDELLDDVWTNWKEPVMDAYTKIEELAEASRRRGTPVPPAAVDAAAALLEDLWAVAAAHGMTAGHYGHDLHLPRAALYAALAPASKEAARSRGKGRARMG